MLITLESLFLVEKLYNDHLYPIRIVLLVLPLFVLYNLFEEEGRRPSSSRGVEGILTPLSIKPCVFKKFNEDLIYSTNILILKRSSSRGVEGILSPLSIKSCVFDEFNDTLIYSTNILILEHTPPWLLRLYICWQAAPSTFVINTDIYRLFRSQALVYQRSRCAVTSINMFVW